MAGSDSDQKSLKELWLGGREGTLSPASTLKVWSLCKVYQELKVSEKKLYTRAAQHVEKIGGGRV